MKVMKQFLVAIIILCFFNSYSKPKDYLKACWEKQVKPLNGRYISFIFQEKINNIDHGFEPFQLKKYDGKGSLWINSNTFLKSDTLLSGKRTFYSKTHWNVSTLLLLDYGDDELFDVTTDMFQSQVFESARYSPINLIEHFKLQNLKPEFESDTKMAIYKMIIDKSVVKLFIRKVDCLLDKVTILSAIDAYNDELFGDVLTTFSYKNDSKIENLYYSRLVEIEKVNGRAKDEVVVSFSNLVTEAPELVTKPENYSLKDKEIITPEITIEKYSDNIYFVYLNHTDDKIMIVEFADFLFVAEAPLNSRNGELIINEAKKIAPNKPIKYFAFGHFHTHYIGGVRAFVHSGASILSVKDDLPYLQFIINSPHLLIPDSLQLQPKPLQIEEIDKSKTITDGKFEMVIHHIGDKSQHTNDYLIYYFPSEGLLFEDDLVWIAREGEIKKASPRQEGLYNAIIDLKLNVKTILQSWPIKDYGVKTVIPFSDLEQSINSLL